MKLGLIDSAFAGTHIDRAQGIRATKELGFDTIDIFGDPMEMDVKEVRMIRELCEELELPIICTVVVRSASLTSTDRSAVSTSTVQRSTWTLLTTSAREICCWFWANISGSRKSFRRKHNGIGPSRVHANSPNMPERSVWSLHSRSSRSACRLSIQSRRWHAFWTMWVITAAKANVDISHLALAHDEPAEIAKLVRRISHVHFPTVTARCTATFRRGGDVFLFRPYLEALDKAGFQRDRSASNWSTRLSRQRLSTGFVRRTSNGGRHGCT